MAISYDESLAIKKSYEDTYRTRHEAFRALRRYWHGDYWNLADQEQSRPITSVFRDLTSHMSDVGPDIKLVHNIIQTVCNKYQTFLSPLPQIRVWVDPPETDTRRAQATRKQRFLYGCWTAGSMDKVFNNIGWYLPLMGDCFLGIHPDFDKNLPVPLLRSPEHAYPVPSFDKHSEQAVIFSWKVNETVVSKNFSEYNGPIEQMRTARRGIFRRGQNPDPQVEIMEYSDASEWHRWIAHTQTDNKGNQVSLGSQEVNGVVHDLGFNLFQHLKFIDVPDEPWGHGAVEQAINLNEMGNALYSLLFQAVIENVFPRLILEGVGTGVEEIESGPGATIGLPPGAKAYFLAPEGPIIERQNDFMRANELNIRNATGMPGVNFGESPATSIVTGKAVNELMGAGTGSMIEMVQGVGIGNGIVSWNEKAITIGQRMFRDDKMFLFGQEFKSVTELVPERFSLTMQGKDLVGSPRNDVVFAPALNAHEKLVMNLQGLGAGLWSKKYVREQQGLEDNEAMVEEIYGEAADDAVLGAYMQALQGDATPQTAEKVEEEAFAFLQGATPHPLLSVGQAGPPSPGGAPPTGAGVQPTQSPPGTPPGLPVGPPPPGSGLAHLPPPGFPAPQGAAQPAPQAASQTVTLAQAEAAVRAVKGLTGKVWLVGEIAQRGKTDGQIALAVTDPADQRTLTEGLPEWQGRLVIHVVRGQPGEQAVDVSPGSQPTPAPQPVAA